MLDVILRTFCYKIYNLNVVMLNGVSDLKYMCARRVSDFFSRKESDFDGYCVFTTHIILL